MQNVGNQQQKNFGINIKKINSLNDMVIYKNDYVIHLMKRGYKNENSNFN